MPIITFEGKGSGTVRVHGAALNVEFAIDRPEEWSEFLVNGKYKVFAVRRRRRWEFMVSDPDIADYALHAPAGAIPGPYNSNKATLHLPDEAPASVSLRAGAPNA